MKIQHIFIFLTFYEKKMLHDSAYFAHATERERVIELYSNTLKVQYENKGTQKKL